MDSAGILDIIVTSGLPKVLKAFTMVVQSSSAAVGVVQKLYDIGAITLIGAIPMVLGANIGITITGQLAATKGSKNAKRVAFIHSPYNLIGTRIMLPLISPIANLLGGY